MGIAHGYRCMSCRYSIDHMVELFDCGMIACVVGIACSECRELQVIGIPGRPWEERAEAAALSIKAGKVPDGIRCKNHPRHPISLWSRRNGCPRCGRPIERDELEIIFD